MSCIFDRIAKRIAVQTDVAVDVVDSPLIGANAARMSMIISAPTTNRITLSYAGAAVLDRGITLYPGNPPLILSYQTHGQLVQGALRAISATLAQNVTVCEG